MFVGVDLVQHGAMERFPRVNGTTSAAHFRLLLANLLGTLAFALIAFAADEVAIRVSGLVASRQSPVATVSRAVCRGHENHLYKTREDESKRGRDPAVKKMITGLPPHVQPPALAPPSDSRFNRYKLSPSHPSKGRKEKKVKAFVAFEKRVEIKSWLSQKLRKAKVYSDKLTNQNVLFFRLHKKQDVT